MRFFFACQFLLLNLLIIKGLLENPQLQIFTTITKME